jgi:excisionase family DNA binding protein
MWGRGGPVRSVDQVSQKPEPEDLLTLDEVVAWLRVPRSWVYERTRKGQIPCLKLGKYLRFDRDELLA